MPEQPLAQRYGVPDPDRLAVPGRTASEGRDVLRPEGTLSTTPPRLPVDFGGDRDRELREPVEVVDGAVDRIGDPADPAEAADVVALLADEAVVGPAAEDQRRGSARSQARSAAVTTSCGSTWSRRPRRPRARSLDDSSAAARAASSARSQQVLRGRSSESAPQSAGRSPRGSGSSPPGRRSQRSRPSDRPRRARRSRRARGRPLEQQVAHHGDEPRVDAGRRRAHERQAELARPSPPPRCRGRRRPPCGRRRTRSAPRPPPGTPLAGSARGGR